MEKEKHNPKELHKVFFLKPYPPLTEERVLAACVSYTPLGSAITIIEDLVGVSMWSSCKSTTLIKGLL